MELWWTCCWIVIKVLWNWGGIAIDLCWYCGEIVMKLLLNGGIVVDLGLNWCWIVVDWWTSWKRVVLKMLAYSGCPIATPFAPALGRFPNLPRKKLTYLLKFVYRRCLIYCDFFYLPWSGHGGRSGLIHSVDKATQVVLLGHPSTPFTIKPFDTCNVRWIWSKERNIEDWNAPAVKHSIASLPPSLGTALFPYEEVFLSCLHLRWQLEERIIAPASWCSGHPALAHNCIS